MWATTFAKATRMGLLGVKMKSELYCIAGTARGLLRGEPTPGGLTMSFPSASFSPSVLMKEL